MEFRKLDGEVVSIAESEAQVWAWFAAAHLSSDEAASERIAAETADKMLAEFRKRFSFEVKE